MSDVVAAALIGGLVGLLGSVGTIIVTRWNMTDQARERQLVRDDAHRQVRLDYYARLSDQLGRLQKYAELGYPPSKTDWTNWLDMYVWSSGLVVLVSDLPVKEAVNRFTAALEQAAPDLRAALSESEDEAMSIDSPTWVDAYGRHRGSLDAARVELLERMATAVATE